MTQLEWRRHATNTDGGLTFAPGYEFNVGGVSRTRRSQAYTITMRHKRKKAD